MQTSRLSKPPKLIRAGTIESLQDIIGARRMSAIEATLAELIANEPSPVHPDEPQPVVSWRDQVDWHRERLDAGPRALASLTTVSVTFDDGTSIDVEGGEAADLARDLDYGRITHLGFSLSVEAFRHVDSVSARFGPNETSVSIETEAPSNGFAGPVSEWLDTLDPYSRPRESTEPLTVFIGHGGDNQWEVLREFVLDAGHEVVAFESDDRTGQGTLEVVERMIRSADVAFLVMTGADVLTTGTVLPRANVVHELGFAQGALGTARAIMMLADGVEELSNMQGITQIRFRPGELHRTKEPVLAAISNRGLRRGS